MTKVWNSIWDSYKDIPTEQIMNEPAGKTQRAEFAELLMKHFDIKGKSILEVGTGTGQYSIELSKHGAFCTGIDLEQGSVDLATRIASDSQADNCVFNETDVFDINLDYNYDIVFSMGTVEHFNQDEIIAMFRKMAEIADYVVVGVPYSGSHAYMFAKEISMAMDTWEYGVENDFWTLKNLFEASEIEMIEEKTIGLVSEAMYLKRVNHTLIPVQIAINKQKQKAGRPFGSWLIAVGRS